MVGEGTRSEEGGNGRRRLQERRVSSRSPRKAARVATHGVDDLARLSFGAAILALLLGPVPNLALVIVGLDSNPRLPHALDPNGL